MGNGDRGSAGPDITGAIERGNYQQLQVLLSERAYESSVLCEPLAIAAKQGDCAALRLLLESGADPNLACDKFDPPLLLAIAEDHTEAALILLAAGADPGAHAGTPFLKYFLSALQEAAARGSKQVVEMLLDRGADPEEWDIMGHGQPLFQAAFNGHDEVARLIYDHITLSRERQRRKYFEDHGFALLPERMTRPELVLAGSQDLADREDLMRRVAVAEPRTASDLPFTVFDGWVKQLDRERMSVVLLEALDTLFPLFAILGSPPPKALPRLLHKGSREGDNHIRFARERRFAGDHLLPRGRYYSLCDSSGNDDKTICNELFAYRDVRASDEITLIDTSCFTDREMLVSPPPLSEPSIYVVMRPGTGGINSFLHRAGLGQKESVFFFPVRVEHRRLDRVIDLRQPATQSWFTRFFSDFVDDISEWSKTEQQGLRWWPNRPALSYFQQILPSLLTQELGGNAFTRGVGSWLRRSDVEAFIYPSARSDVSLTVANGVALAPAVGIWSTFAEQSTLSR